MSGGTYPSVSRGQLRRFAKLHQKKHRDAEGAFLAEGLRTVNELLRHLPSDGDLLALLVEPGMLSSVDRAGCFGDRIFLLDEASAARVSGTAASQGVVGVFRRQRSDGIPDRLRAVGGRSLVVALDEVQDPGNVGTIVRTASWFGAAALFSGPGTADRYNSKAVRASAGSVFCLPHHVSGDLCLDLRKLRDAGYRLVCSSPQGDDVRSFTDRSEKTVLVIGNEAQGIRRELLEMADRLVAIPHAGSDPGVESLNAAVSAAILLARLSL